MLKDDAYDGNLPEATPVMVAMMMPTVARMEPPIGSFPRRANRALQGLGSKETTGLVIRQETQIVEVVAQMAGVPYEQANEYMVTAIPQGRRVKQYPGDPLGWEPTQTEMREMEKLLLVKEESSCFTRALATCFNVKNLRPLKLHFTILGGGDVYLVDRPFKCGGWACCPLEMNLFRTHQATSTADGGFLLEPFDAVIIGRVKEDFDNYFSACLRTCCTCTYNHEIQRLATAENGDRVFQTQYVLKANVCCCGPTNNCCGATCFKNDAVFCIYDVSGTEVARVQKTYGGRGDCMGALCRCMYHFDNYVLEFPEDATTVDDRMLILTSIFQLDYHLFESSGDNDNNKDNARSAAKSFF